MILGLHHLTATVDRARADLDFYERTLGLRLIKKTVNFDNRGVYHFYYGDERGSPGTLMTTFPYGGQGVPVGTHGAGQITATSFSVPEGSLGGWRERLAAAGFEVGEPGERFGDEVLSVVDPSGLVIELVGAADDPRDPWVAPERGADAALRGLYAPSLSIRDPDRSIAFLADVLGWEVTGEESGRTRLAAGGDRPGHRLEIVHAGDAPDAVNGLGTVHHIAMAVEGDEEQLAIREELLRLGVHVTPRLDRQYFRSIYFREPGGVLYEVATMGPGFLVDEEVGALGCGLMLPPWEEPNRAAIEEALPDVGR